MAALRLALVCLIVACGALPAFAWTTAAPVAMTSQDSLEPRVAVDSIGKACVVWRERTGGSNFQIWYSNNTSGAFFAPVQISQGGSPQCYWPVIAVNGSDVHAAWSSDQSGSNFEAWYRKCSGGSWGGILNASNTPIKSLRPALAVRGSVGPVVTWDEALYADDNYDVLFSEWTGSGFGSSYNVSNTVAPWVYGSVNSNLVIAPNGDIAVVWAERITGDYHVNARRRVGGVWQARQEISTKLYGPATPGIAVAPDGQVHVVYAAEDQVWHQTWNGSAWTAPVALPGGIGQAIRPKIAVDDQGFAHVVLDNSQYGNGEIYYSTNASSSWSAWTNISNTANTDSMNADIAHAGGTLTVIWQENSNQSGGTGVYNTWYARHNLPPTGPSGTIAGVVRDQFGAGIAGAVVNAAAYQTISGSGGGYSLTVPVGTCTVTANKAYYTGTSVPGVVVSQNQTTTLDLTITANPPGPVTAFTANPSDTVNRLYWTNPTSGNYAGTLIRWKTTGYPTGPADGALLCDRSAAPGSADNVTHSGLANGLTYYYSAYAHDSDGHHSSAATAFATPHRLTCLEAEKLADGSGVDLSEKIVSAIYSADGCLYVQEHDRTSGVRVAHNGTGFAVGDRVSVTGTLGTRILSGHPSERVISGPTITRADSGSPAEPLAMKGSSVGGAAIVPNVPGVIDDVGLNNMGLLVKVTGSVTAKLTNYLWIDDGSGVVDPNGNVGVMVRCASAPTQYNKGDYVSAVGVVEGSIYLNTTGNRRCVRCRWDSDLAKLR